MKLNAYIALFIMLVCVSFVPMRAQAPLALIQPEALATMLKLGKAPKPLMLHVGSHFLFVQGHIPGSEYVGAGGSPEGLQQLRKRIEKLPHNQFIILYCGCCPWSHCPNVKPAYNELRARGFTNVKVLYIEHNFATDWSGKGYPVVRGE